MRDVNGLDTLREDLAAFLRGKGLDAVTAWNHECRTRLLNPVVAVSLRAVQGGPAGLMDYLGERLDPDSGRWVELYGKRAKLTFGLDIFAPPSAGEAGCAAAFARLSDALTGSKPAGLAVQELSCGETAFDQSARLLHCPAQMTCCVFLFAISLHDGQFSDFHVRGTQSL